MADRIEIDETYWPLVVVRFPHEPVGAAAFSAYLEGLSALLERKQTYATFTDTRTMTDVISAKQRSELSAWIESHADDIGRYSAGTALVVRSAVIRGVLVAINWIRPPPNPQRVFATYPEGLEWALSQLRDSGALSTAAAARTRHLVLAEQPSTQVPAETSEATDVPDAGPLGPAIDLFEEPAFLLSRTGVLVFANQSARKAFATAPSWLPAVVSSTESPVTPLCRVQRVQAQGGSLYLVVPMPELQPSERPDPRASIELPPSLDGVASLLAEGLSDKEIARRSGRSLATVRTYVTRIFRKVGVNSRGEFIRLWSSRAAG